MLPRPALDETRLERRCIQALQGADRERYTAASPAEERLCTVEASFASLGWMYMDLDRAVVELESVIALQRQDGCIPRAEDAAGAALPLVATILRMIYHSARSRHRRLEGRLAALVPAVDRFHQHLQERDRRRLCHVGPADEQLPPEPPDAGDDEEPQPDVGFNAVLVQAETDLADVSIHTGYPTREIIARRTHRSQAIADLLWSEEHELFVSTSGRLPTVGGLLPVWCGAALGHQARAMIARYLPSEEVHGFPVATSLEPCESPAPWQGAMMPLLNWLLVRGAYRYGFEALASRLENAVLAAADAVGLWEGYHPVSGEGVGRQDATMTAVIVLDLLKTPYDFERWGVY